jgi:hypothetical protein
MTESIEDSSSSNDEPLISEDEFNKFTSTLDEFTPVIPETVTKYYMRQCGLHTEDDRVVKLLSVSVQKFMSGNLNIKRIFFIFILKTLLMIVINYINYVKNQLIDQQL